MDRLSVEQVDQKLYDALIIKNNKNFPAHIVKDITDMSVINKLSIARFYDAAVSNGNDTYINMLVSILIDIKLQMFYIGEIDMAIYNRILYTPEHDSQNPNAYDQLKKMSLDQNLIIKSRILWERMINFASVYICGKELEGSSRKSKKKKFKEIAQDTPWEFLLNYWETLQWYDDHLRTPEVHSGSVLRKAFLDKTIDTDPNHLMTLYNIAINSFYPNIMLIVNNEKPNHSVWVMGMQEDQPDFNTVK